MFASGEKGELEDYDLVVVSPDVAASGEIAGQAEMSGARLVACVVV